MDRVDVSTMSHEELRGYTAAMSGGAIGMFTAYVVNKFLAFCERGGGELDGRGQGGGLLAPTGRQHPHPSAPTRCPHLPPFLSRSPLFFLHSFPDT